MKTPDEIKKGLGCCVPVWVGNHWKTCNSNCPYIGLAESCRGQLVHDALAYIRQLEAQTQKWISVEERLPDPFERVLVARKGKEELVVDWGFRDVGIWWKVYGTRTKNVFFWMPLPEPPKEE